MSHSNLSTPAVTSGVWVAVVGLASIAGAVLKIAQMQIALDSLALTAGTVAGLAALGAWYRVGTLAPVVRRIATAVAQLVLMCASLAVLTYALARLESHRPVLDATLARADHALGFDWWTVRHALYALPGATTLLKAAYLSIGPQMFACTLWLAMRREGRDIGAFIVAYGFAALLCIGIMAVLGGAVGNFPAAPYAIELVAVRAGGRALLRVNDLHGIVSFPSFHAAAAVLFAWTGWRTPVRWAVVAIDLLMGLSTITEGAHYLVDVLAGLGIAGVAIVVTPTLVAALAGGEQGTHAASAPADRDRITAPPVRSPLSRVRSR